MDEHHLVDNIAASLGKTQRVIQKQMVEKLTRADTELGKRVTKAVKLT